MGRSDGHPWGDPVAVTGEFRWPPTRSFPWPPSGDQRTGWRQAMPGVRNALLAGRSEPKWSPRMHRRLAGRRRRLLALRRATGVAARALIIRGTCRLHIALSGENVACPCPTPDNAQPQINPGLSWRFQDARSDVKGGLCPAVRWRRGRWVCRSALLRRRAAQQDPHAGAAQVGSTPHLPAARPEAFVLASSERDGGEFSSSSIPTSDASSLFDAYSAAKSGSAAHLAEPARISCSASATRLVLALAE
jgi:hypothetical protein